jgi:hypothetical protein
MKIFNVINKKIPLVDRYGERKFDKIRVTLFEPPYDNEHILKHTNWEEKDCEITEYIVEEIK